MNIYFRVRVNTKAGDEVYITGASSVLGNYYPDKAFRMSSAGCNAAGETLWEARLQFDSLKERVLRYKYFVKSQDGTLTYEVGGGRRIALNSATTKIESVDHWQEYTEEAPFLTDPFAHVLYGTSYAPYTQIHNENNELIIRAVVPNVPRDCRIVLCGEGKRLGSWKPEHGVKMARLKGLKWIASFSTLECKGQVWKYKFAMVNDVTGEYVFETLSDDAARELAIPEIGRNETFIKEHSQVKFPPVFRKFAGCGIPVSALRSSQSGGCGEILDLKLLVDWAEKTGMKVVEIFPLNETAQTFTGRDSSPYRAVSSLGINPLLLSLREIGPLADPQKEKEAQREIKSLNRRATVDYEDLYYFKKKYLEALFLERGKKDEAHPDYYTFLNEHRDWVYAYALFCALRDLYKTADFSKWEAFGTYSEDLSVAFGNRRLSRTFAAAHSVLGKLSWETVQIIHNKTQFHIWLQFHLFRQLDQVMKYAHGKGIALKGELQMKVVPFSVDCWKFPHLFKGVDPDGFAAYDWKALDAESFMWWKKRIRVMSWYLDIYSISKEVPYMPEDEPLYRKMIPQILAASNMMVWASGWESLRLLPDFYRQEGTEAPYLSVVRSSNPVLSTLRMWLGERNKTLVFKSEDKKRTYFDATVEECIAEAEGTLEEGGMFAILPLQDWLSLSNRLRSRFPYSETLQNGNGKVPLWNYRIHVNLESLLGADSLNTLIAKLIKDTGR